MDDLAPPVHARSYAGIAADARGFPREALWVARVQLACVVLGLTIAGTAALALRIELWSPSASHDMDAYARMLVLHGATMASLVVPLAVFGVLANLAVHESMPGDRSPTWPLAASGALFWVGGAIGVIAISLTASPWAFYDPSRDPTALRLAVAAIALGMTLVALDLTVVAARGSGRAPGGARLVTAVVLVAMFGRVAAIGAAGVEHLRRPELDVHAQLVADGLGAAVWLDVVAALAVLLWLGARRLAQRAGRSDASPWVFGSVLALLSIVGAVLRRIPRRLELEVHLHDTTFEVGVFHLAGAVVVLAVLAGMLAWSEPLLRLRVRRRIASVAMVLLAVGMLGHAIVLLVLGTRGMPRRYVAYPELFTPLQQLAGGFAGLVALGALVFAISFARARARG